MLMLLFALDAAQAQEGLPALIDLLPTTPSFTTARKRMYEVHGGHPTLYCGCSFDENHVVNLASCGLDTFSGTRWERTEAEHVVPASTIGERFPCWEEGGRSHCLDIDPVYKTAHNDLHNLYPAVGHINLMRSDYSMGLIVDEDLEYGSCDIELDVDANRVEPAPTVRGDIARIYFYMEWLYGIPISPGQRRLFLAWHQADPVDAWELERDKRIEALQGNHNPFVFSASVQ